MKYFKIFLFFFIFTGTTFLYAQEDERYQITSVKYNIKGSTLPYPLSKAVPIDQKRVFIDKEKFDYYVDDLEVKFTNQRVFDSSSIEIQFGVIDGNGIIPVFLTINTVDTWNIIALPYPKYDSNSGFNFKLKLKDYNFFGSMQVLNGDVNYQIDNSQKTTVAANLDFSIPFKAWEYSWNWANDLSIEFPQDEIPEFNATTGFDVAIPIGITAITVGIEQSLVINDRSDTEIYSQDPYYFNDKFYMYVPFVLRKFRYMGDLTWTPSASIASAWFLDKIDHSDLKGPSISWAHNMGMARVDWHGNFRTGFAISAGNSYSYNVYTNEKIGVSVNGEMNGYFSFLERAGITGRISGYYNFYDSLSDGAGEKLRGIMNYRISSDSAFTLNVDLPVRIMHVDFIEITGVSWTKYIGFEMHASPFFDMALTHDKITGRYYSFEDAWYSGGMEILVYPMKMRSIYGRISAGFDLAEVAQNGGKLSGRSLRDDSSINELLIGIGLHY